MEFGVFEILAFLAGVVFVLWSYTTFRYDFWKKRGVPGPKAIFPFGNFTDVFIWRRFATDKIHEMYNDFKDERFFGYFVGRKPIFVVKDPELIKQVLIKDFEVFSERGITLNEDVDPLSAHLFNIGGERWKALRPKLSAFFSTGKLKQMFQSINECADHLVDVLKEELKNNETIECREVAVRYTTDVIGSCGLGINTQALADKNSLFRRAGYEIFEPGYGIQLKRLLRQLERPLFSFLRIVTVPSHVTNFFVNAMKESLEMREKEQFMRNDLVDILRLMPNNDINVEMTPNFLTAVAFGFFAAGFEMAGGAISFALWELARNPEIQEKLRQEILEHDRENDGKLTYQSVNEMKYVDMVVRETLRKNTLSGVLSRTATRDYLIPGTDVTLPAGQLVQIPAHSVHHDPKYYPNPEVFNPERFSDEAKKSLNPMVFMAFGNGPKNCIGTRFGYFEVKVALIKIIKNFRVHPTTKIDEPYVPNVNSIVLAAIGGIVLKLEQLENSTNVRPVQL